jgi:hypothetical protein
VQSALDGKLNTNGNAVGLVSGAKVDTMTITNLTTEGSQTMNGTANLAPNQTASSGSSLMTRDLADARYKKIFILRPSDIAAFGNTGTMQRDFPGGAQMTAGRLSANNDAASFWLSPPPAGQTQLVIRSWIVTTNSGALASEIQVLDLPMSGARSIKASNIVNHGSSATGTNINILTNTINVTVSGQVQGLSWVWTTNTVGAVWFTYAEGWWQ